MGKSYNIERTGCILSGNGEVTVKSTRLRERGMEGPTPATSLHGSDEYLGELFKRFIRERVHARLLPIERKGALDEECQQGDERGDSSEHSVILSDYPSNISSFGEICTECKLTKLLQSSRGNCSEPTKSVISRESPRINSVI